MAETVRMNLNVDPDVPGKLAELAGGQRKMGTYLSTLIQQIHAGQRDVGEPGELEALRGTVYHLSSKEREHDALIQQLMARVQRLESEHS